MQRVGVWFIMQDLSVRTEGTFRNNNEATPVDQNGQPLRPVHSAASMNDQPSPPTHANGPTNGASDPKRLNKDFAPVLAYAFSDPFQVYSAKRFPGVIESTEMSKCFALQGIKIPIRKDQVNGAGSKRRGSYLDGDDGADADD
ncbi:MAG: hypothetical protein Q9227_007970 [Pyrenula ochraceoflavens]